MNKAEKEILKKILYAVETGGQVYGKQRYDAFIAANTNTANEKAITIGAGQWYAGEAKKLLLLIRSTNPSQFKVMDFAGISADLDSKNWSTYNVATTSQKAKCIQRIISSDVGVACQDQLMIQQIESYEKSISKTYGTMTAGAMMECINIIHQGGSNALKRILSKTKKPYTSDSIYAALCTDPDDRSNTNQVGDYVSRQKKVYEMIKKYAESGDDTVANYASKVIEIALSEVGYLEKKSNSQLDSKTANAGSANYTKYGRDMHKIYPSVMDFPAAWCDAFVDWCFYKSYGVSNAKGLLGGNFNDYTPSSAQLYKNKGAWYQAPKVGDQIFFTNGTRINHTGLVYKVTSSKVYTIEGNTSGASGVIANGGGVCKKSYTLNYWKIAGYGRPNYTAETSGGTTTTTTKTSTGGGYMFEVKNLVKGNKGNDVKLLQRLLVGHGYSVGKAGIDGDFGSATEAVVEKFQKDENIKVNYPGTVGPKTWKALIGL